MVFLTNMNEKSSSFAAVEYSIGNRPEFLRENKPIESHVTKGELKIYKYSCQDSSVKKVKIYINKISGCFDSWLFRKIPSTEQI